VLQVGAQGGMRPPHGQEARRIQRTRRTGRKALHPLDLPACVSAPTRPHESTHLLQLAAQLELVA
jgi:hypothetical protein